MQNSKIEDIWNPMQLLSSSYQRQNRCTTHWYNNIDIFQIKNMQENIEVQEFTHFFLKLEYPHKVKVTSKV